MSQNKTIVPGVDPDAFGSPTNLGGINPPLEDDAFANFYTRSSEVANRTLVGGEEATVSPQPAASAYGLQVQAASQAAQPQALGAAGYVEQAGGRQLTLQNRVVVGALFSISRGLLGEIFPLYLGRNLIGSAPHCDVCLAEQTVQGEHATLIVRRYGPQYMVSLTDSGTFTGTQVCGQPLQGGTAQVGEGSVIGIGSHYRLLLKLFNIEEAGLEECPDFVPMAQGPGADPASSTTGADFYAPSQDAGTAGPQRTVIS